MSLAILDFEEGLKGDAELFPVDSGSMDTELRSRGTDQRGVPVLVYVLTARDQESEVPVEGFTIFRQEWPAGSNSYGFRVVSPDYLGNRATSAVDADLHETSAEDPDLDRGVFTLTRTRKVLFRSNVIFRISDLPRKGPNVSLDWRDLDP